MNWNEVATAHGDGAAIPALLEAVGRGDHAALERLADLINHQGQATPAALPTLPFLGALLDGPDGLRAELLILVADLACAGNHEGFAVKGLQLQPRNSFPEAFLALHDAACALQPRLLLLLTDQAPEVRAAAALALAFTETSNGDSAVTALRTQLAGEADPSAAASALIALRLLENRASAPATLERTLELRFAEALVAARDTSDCLPRLVEFTASEPTSRLPWYHGNIARFAAHALSELGAMPADLLRAMSAVDTPAAQELARSLIEGVFPTLDKQTAQGVHPSDCTALSGAQRAVLIALAQRNVLAGLPYVLAAKGLWDTQPELLRALAAAGGESIAGLDARHAGKPLWRWCREALFGECTESEWLAAVQGSGEPVMAVCRDAARAGYRLNTAFAYRPDAPKGPRNQARLFEAEVELLELLVATLLACCSLEEVATAIGDLDWEGTGRREAAMWLVTLQRFRARQGASGPLAPQLDPLLAKAAFAPYAPLMREVVRALPVERREALKLNPALWDV